MRPLRIAFINCSGEIGGAERSLLLLLEQLDRQRYAPMVICPSSGRLVDALGAIQVPTRVVPLGKAELFSRFASSDWAGTARAALGVGHGFSDLARTLSAVQPDLIHTNGMKAHLMGGLCGRLLRRPVIWHVRDLVPEGRMLALFRSAGNWLPRRIIANSAAVAAQFAGCRAADATRVVHNAVDRDGFRPRRAAAEVREQLGFGPETVVLAMVAHFTRWKGHLLFLDVIARLRRQGLPVAGLIVGGAIYRTNGHQDYEAEVHAHCRSLGLQGHAVFTGYQDCVPDFLNAADLLVHPPTRPEPFGRVIIEAMALGKPVVAAAAGGVLEIIDPGSTGMLAAPGDAAAFAEAVRALVCDPQQRAAIGQRAREDVARRFTPALHVARIESVYQELVS